jgi:predicted aldo/keto reductase-like oxidoreductase
MRSYMYAYGYRQPKKARSLLAEKESHSITCRECGNCAVTCTLGFDVPEKIKDILRILDISPEFLA